MNSEVVNILVSIDKNADKIIKKYSIETSQNPAKESYTQFPSTTKPIFHARTPSFVQQDRRERRTLRAKVNCILNSLPTICKSLSRKQLKLMLNEKKKKLNQINSIRVKANKEPLYTEDISFDTSFDNHGNIKPKLKEISQPLTPRTALKSKLSPSEYEMLKEDPVYFIQNEMYKYKIKLDEDENWEKLLDGEIHKKSNPSKSLSKTKEKKKEFKRTEKSLKTEEKKKKEIVKVKSFQVIKEILTDRNPKKITENRKRDVEKNRGTIDVFYKRLEQIRALQQKEREVDEKIIKFEKEAKKAEEMYTMRLREKALLDKIASTKSKLRRGLEESESPKKMRIKYSLREL